LIQENISTLQPHLPLIVNKTNIANFYGVFSNSPKILSQLANKALELVGELHIAGIKMIS